VSRARLLYTLAWIVATPLVALYLLWRSLRQPQYRLHWRERFFGSGAVPGGTGPVFWVHAVSVGETRAAQPLIEALAAALPDSRFVFTHVTPTGRAEGERLAQRMRGRLVQRYLPYEVPWALARFLREARPALGVLMETEVWPNLLAAARAARVPMVLVNARLSEKSLARALRYPALAREAAAAFSAVLAQTAADGARLRRLYDGPIEVTGNLKFDLAPPAELIEQGRALRAQVGARPVWLFASTREGEEAQILEALRAWRSGPLAPEARADGAGREVDGCSAPPAAAQPPALPDVRDAVGEAAGSPSVRSPLVLIVPRHPQRFDAVAAAIVAAGWSARRRSQGASLADAGAGAIYLGDSMGELALYYAAADVALIGGSLLPFGAQNLIEACACGCPVVLGPSTFNFAQAAADALAAGAAVQVEDASGALEAMASITRDAARRSAMRAACLQFAQAHRGATGRSAARLLALVSRSAGR